MSANAQPTNRRAFVFAGGGTGGHIYPALAIIEELRAIDPHIDVHILCSNRPIDTAILKKHDVPFTAIAAMPMSKKIKGLVKFITSWGPSVRATRECIKQLKQENDAVVLIAMGGFVAAPGAHGGRVEKSKVVLVNLDAVPGKANMLIAKKADQVYTAAEIIGDDPRFAQWEQVRPIVRRQKGDGDAGKAREAFGLDPATKTLLITGGSQGATSINGFVRTMLEHQPEAFADWQVIHQVGSKINDDELDQLRSVYRDAKVHGVVERYIDDMSSALLTGDLAIGRCGAGSVAECWDAQMPCLFFPYPYHADEHQKHNAQVLVDAGVAIIFTDQIDPQANFKAHGQACADILMSSRAFDAMKQGYTQMSSPDGARVIAESMMS